MRMPLTEVPPRSEAVPWKMTQKTTRCRSGQELFHFTHTNAPIRDERCDPSIPTPAYAAQYKR